MPSELGHVLKEKCREEELSHNTMASDSNKCLPNVPEEPLRDVSFRRATGLDNCNVRGDLPHQHFAPRVHPVGSGLAPRCHADDRAESIATYMNTPPSFLTVVNAAPNCMRLTATAQHH